MGEEREGGRCYVNMLLNLGYSLLEDGSSCRGFDPQSTATNPPPPGLSFALVSKVTGGNFPEPDQLEKVKLAVLRLLSSEIFTPNEVICHFVVAAGDPRTSVSDQADRHLRILGGSVDWERAPLVSRLFSLYQGTVVTPGKRTRPQSAPARESRAPATLRVRLRIMPYLMKSTLAANSFPACVQVSTPKLLLMSHFHTVVVSLPCQPSTASFPYHFCC